MKPRKRFLSLLLCGTVFFSLCPQTMAFAEAGAVQESGVTIAASGLCEHHPEHTAECGYTEKTGESLCTHEHDDTCGYAPATEGTPCGFVCGICNPQEGTTADNGTPGENHTAPKAGRVQQLAKDLISRSNKKISVRIRAKDGKSDDVVSGGEQTELGTTHTITVTPNKEKYVIAGYFAGTDYATTINPKEYRYKQMTLDKITEADKETRAVKFQFTATEFIPIENDTNYDYICLYFYCAKLPELNWPLDAVYGEATAPSSDGAVEAKSYISKNELYGSPGNSGYYSLDSGDSEPYLKWTVASITDETGAKAGGSVSFEGNHLTYTPTFSEAGKTITVKVQPELGYVTNEIKSLSFEIKVKKAAEFLVTIWTEGNGGSAIATPNYATEGSEIKLTSIPNQGYHFKEWRIISGNITISNESTFIMPAENVTIMPIFEPDAPISAAPKITTDSLPGGAVGTAYSKRLEAESGTPMTWSIESGSLPDGLSLSGDTISGTPTAAGTFTFTVKAENSVGSDTKELSVTITETAHIHDWTGAWGSDDTHHWRECANPGCGETDNSKKGSYGEHTYTDGVCDCGKLETEEPGGGEEGGDPETPGGEEGGDPETPGGGEEGGNPETPGGEEGDNPDNPGGEEGGDIPEKPGESEATKPQAHHTHQYAWKLVREADAEQDGEEIYVCDGCGSILARQSISAFGVYCKEVLQQIEAAETGADVEIVTNRWTSYPRYVLEALERRPDITLVTDFRYQGKDYRFTIPAENTSAEKENGGTYRKNKLTEEGMQWYGYLYLGGKYGLEEIEIEK